jgi:N-methylhydantoinase B/oxoprolinase/acetone carboxylase alpha subunit
MPADPIEFELFKNALFSVADEMALTIFRTTYSGVLKDNMDYSTAMFDADGQLAAQGLTLPGHLGSMPTAMAAILRRFEGAIFPGDVSPMPGRSATIPMSAAGWPARTPPTRPRSIRKDCASRR